MKRAFKTMLAVSACMLVMPLSVHAAQPVDGQVIDGSLLTHNESVETSEVFDWDFPDQESEVAPLGVYYALGTAGIAKKSSTSAYITATTTCYKTCASVTAEVNLQRLDGSTWKYVTERSNTEKNTDYVDVRATVSVKKGYYYRVVSFHSATKNGKTETGSATSESLYIG